MSLLIVAGVTVGVASATRLAPEQIGSVTRAYAGNLRSTVRVEKRGWKVTSVLMIAADIETFRAAVAAGAAVSCSGDLLGATITCVVTIGDSDYVAVNGSDALGFMRPITFTLREV